jgi:hypothetical protein
MPPDAIVKILTSNGVKTALMADPRKDDFVWHGGTLLRVVQINEIAFLACCVLADSPVPEATWFAFESLTIATCKHCHQAHTDHADNEKCLFEPTNWAI